jgi:hypothetical protein
MPRAWDRMTNRPTAAAALGVVRLPLDVPDAVLVPLSAGEPAISEPDEVPAPVLVPVSFGDAVSAPEVVPTPALAPVRFGDAVSAPAVLPAPVLDPVRFAATAGWMNRAREYSHGCLVRRARRKYVMPRAFEMTRRTLPGGSALPVVSVPDDAPDPVEEPESAGLPAISVPLDVPAPVEEPDRRLVAVNAPDVEPAPVDAPVIFEAAASAPEDVPAAALEPVSSARAVSAALEVPAPVLEPLSRGDAVRLPADVPAPVDEPVRFAGDGPPATAAPSRLSNQPSGVARGSNHDASLGSKRPRLLTVYANRLIVPNDPASTVVAVAVSDRHRKISVPEFGPFSISADSRAT